jgi:hypothetical protein
MTQNVWLDTTGPLAPLAQIETVWEIVEKDEESVILFASIPGMGVLRVRLYGEQRDGIRPFYEELIVPKKYKPLEFDPYEPYSTYSIEERISSGYYCCPTYDLFEKKRQGKIRFTPPALHALIAASKQEYTDAKACFAADFMATYELSPLQYDYLSIALDDAIEPPGHYGNSWLWWWEYNERVKVLNKR